MFTLPIAIQQTGAFEKSLMLMNASNARSAAN